MLDAGIDVVLVHDNYQTRSTMIEVATALRIVGWQA